MDTTRQLLLALLAVQRGLIEYARVVEAWADPGGEGGSLADRLVRRGWLSAQTRHELEAEVDRQLCPAGTLPASMHQDTDDARKALAVLANSSDEPAANDVGEGRYSRTELHARGGMGLVWRTHDAQIGREVALKELQPQFDDRPTLRARFLAEARITGQLEHPGIVPVYEVLERPGEAPCYVMRLVRGRTLSEAAREFHAGHAQAARLDVVALRDLLGAFVSVCQTLAYAHSRGVVHRDLKGANVVLGPFGEVVVLDWGLAKVLNDAAADEPAVRPLNSGDLDATEQGRVGGTPAYMAPEQALGQGDRMDRRTDVFGLGAVLYEILTGQPPYRGGAGKADVLLRAQQGVVTPPRQLLRLVPPPLEAVCLKAVAARPEDRYQTATELADEVKRWLAGAPVAAWPEPWPLRVGRWVRKHRALAAATAAALVVALVLGSTGAFAWQQRRQSARDKAREGMAHAAQLRRQYRWEDARKALDQVDAWLSQAWDDRLRARLAEEEENLALAHALDRVRLRGAGALVDGRWKPERVRDEYPEVLARHGFDALDEEVAALARRIRDSAVREVILAALDDWASYETDASRLQRVLELANQVDEDAWRRYVRRAVAAGDKAGARQLIGRVDEGRPTAGVVVLAMRGSQMRWVEQATSLLRRMHHEQPSDYWVSFVLGELLAEQQKHREAAMSYLLCTALRPAVPIAHYNLGVALHLSGDLRGAIAAFRKAIACDPNHAEAHYRLGHALWQDKDGKEAAAAFRRAVACDPRYAEAHSALGDLLSEGKDVPGAIAAWRQALAHDPNRGKTYFNLGMALMAAGDVAGAIDAFRMAVERDPTDAAAHCRLGRALQSQGLFSAALVHLKKGDDLGSRQPGWTYPSAAWLAQCEGLIVLDQRLTAVLAGRRKASNAAELMALARLCLLYKQRPATAVRFYLDGFAVKPELADNLRLQHRYHAACAAALAGAGHGEDSAGLDATDRARLRYTALAWLQDELSAHARQFTAEARPALAHWRANAHLVSVHDRGHLDNLPEAEQVAWGNLWAQVDALLAQPRPSR